jgi:DNA-binding IclR family transcriptional regulator
VADAKRTGGMRARALGDAIGVRGPQPEPRDVLTSVSRALAVLEAIAASPQPIPAKAVARQLGISLGTSYHVLHTLEHAGYVVRLGQGRFGLGSKVPALYHLFREQLDLVPTVRPLLGELSERAGEDAYLAVFRAGEVVVAEVVEGPSDLHLEGLGEGFSRIAHSTALGKVLLAAAPEAVVDGYLEERRLEPFTRRTLVRRKHIKRHRPRSRSGASAPTWRSSPTAAAAWRSRSWTPAGRPSPPSGSRPPATAGAPSATRWWPCAARPRPTPAGRWEGLGQRGHGEPGVAQLLPVELRALALAAPNPRASARVDAVGERHPAPEVDARDVAGERRGDVVERVVVVVQDDHVAGGAPARLVAGALGTAPPGRRPHRLDRAHAVSLPADGGQVPGAARRTKPTVPPPPGP